MKFKNNTNTVIDYVHRGDIYYADLGEPNGSEQGGIRPVIIVQNNIGNKYSPTVLAAAITDKNHKKANIPTHVFLDAKNTGLKKDSIALFEQIRVLDKRARLLNKIGKVNQKDMSKINNAIAIAFGIK